MLVNSLLLCLSCDFTALSNPSQVLTYHGFYDENLEWVGLENIQVVASMSARGAVGRHVLTSRFTSIVRICTIE